MNDDDTKDDYARTAKGDAMLVALLTGDGQEYLKEFRERFRAIHGRDYPLPDDELRGRLIRIMTTQPAGVMS